MFGSGLIVSYGSLALQQTNVPLFGRTAPMLVVLLSSVIAVILLRDRLQRQMDRQFFREKYPLDRALERMNSAVSGLLEPRAVSEHLLSSCCDVLHITEAVLYLRNQRRGDDQSFVLTASQGGRTDAPMIIPLDEELLTMLREGTSFQRIPSGTSAVQNLLRRLKSELLHGFEVDGEIHGFLALGSKPSSMPYTSEDATILTAMSRVTGVALHCAKVHEDVTRLNESVRLKVDKIAEQGRQICVLQNELASLSTGVPGGRDAVDFSRGAMKGSGTAIQHVFGTVRKVAASDTSVLIRGESGTGKELLARAVHENSLRRDRPLIPVHCGALSPSLLESELFGHVKGAFTGANTDKIGRIALADKGTLFLDEIGDVSLDVQVKLLRVLQERLIEPVGSSQPLAVDVRLIAATHQNLEQMIAQGRFREDLYYRLNVITVTLPPLRERKDDLFELAISFLRTASQKTGRALVFEEATIDLMLRYDWPGNIRQLQNVVERAAVLAEGDRITPAEMPAEVREAIPLGEGDTPTKRDGFNAPPPRSRGGGSRRIYTPLYDQPRLADRPMSGPLTRDARPNMLDSNDERQQLVESLQRCGGNKAEAARLLGLPRSTFFSRLKKHGL